MGFFEQVVATLQFDYLLVMTGAVFLGIVMGILPGLGGSITLALLIPVTFSLSPEMAMVILLAAYPAAGFGGCITSILINTPGTAENSVTTLDGFPLAKQGKARFAISAALFSSAMGGIIGLIVLILLIPVARKLVLMFSYPEFFMLAIFGLTVIAIVTKGNSFRGVISALVGLMLAFVGTDPIISTTRFTFGTDYLWDGIGLIPVIIGLFALTEAFSMFEKKSAIANEKFTLEPGGTLDGIKAVFKHYWLFLRSCMIGVFIGIVPGVGGSVASFMAYGTAVNSSKNPEKFGKGAIEGIVAAEGANDAKDGGALLPTLAFGIPGSTGMAVLMGGLLMHGLVPGPKMLTEDLEMTNFLLAVTFVSKFITYAVAMIIGVRLVFITKIRGSLMAPGVVAISLVGAYAMRGSLGDVIVAVVFGLIGLWMKKYGYSAVALIIALVLGGLVEQTYHQTMTSFGASGFFTRPITFVLFLMTLFSLFWPVVKRKLDERKSKGGLSA